METIDEGMVKSPGYRDHAVLQFPPGERRNRGAHRVFRMGHRSKVEPRQTAGADKMFAIDDERRRRCLSCRDDLRRCRGAEGGELGSVVAPYLAEALLDGHHRRHDRQAVIFNHLAIAHALPELRHPVGRAQQGIERELKK